MSDRPPLDQSMTEAEFRRWYWTMAELQPFARLLGVSATGRKAAIAERIAARLGDRPPPEPSERTRRGPQLTGELSMRTQIPPGQRSSNELRAFFEREIGAGFRFNGHMRSFLLAGGTRLAQAVDHWHATVGTPLPRQSESLEFNRFTKDWHRAHPGGTNAECRAAWAVHRATPIDER